MAILTVMQSDLSWASLIGGRLCLDFVNTLGGTRAQGSTEHLVDYATLIDWAQHAGAVDSGAARQLRREAAAHPRAAAEALAAAHALREALFWALFAIGHGDAPSPEDVALVERHLKRALSEPR